MPHYPLVLVSEKALGGYQGKTTLELGAGRGVDSAEMALRGAFSYVVDFSENSLTTSLNIAQSHGVEVVPCQADASELPLPNDCFDLVFSQGLLEHPHLMRTILPEKIRVAKPGGLILIDVPQLISIQAAIKWAEIKTGTWPFGPESNYTERQLKKIVEGLSLKYVSSYGWGLIPMVHLGIRTRLIKLLRSSPSLNLAEQIRSKQVALGLSKLGPKIMNNIGLIAQKPEI